MSQDIKDAILDILARAPGPLTTAEIRRALQPISASRDIYAILFVMQSSGLIQCTVSSPWTWSKAGLDLPPAAEVCG
ncbi:MAG: hypothetical protein AAF441_10285 [Pseudomonadota bacterium]